MKKLVNALGYINADYSSAWEQADALNTEFTRLQEVK